MSIHYYPSNKQTTVCPSVSKPNQVALFNRHFLFFSISLCFTFEFVLFVFNSTYANHHSIYILLYMFYVDALDTQSKILMVQLCVYDCRARNQFNENRTIIHFFFFLLHFFVCCRRQFVRLVNLTHLIHSVSVVGVVCLVW